jgi:hypothetical protein
LPLRRQDQARGREAVALPLRTTRGVRGPSMEELVAVGSRAKRQRASVVSMSCHG